MHDNSKQRKGVGCEQHGLRCGGVVHWPAYIIFGCECMHCFHAPATNWSSLGKPRYHPIRRMLLWFAQSEECPAGVLRLSKSVMASTKKMKAPSIRPFKMEGRKTTRLSIRSRSRRRCFPFYFTKFIANTMPASNKKTYGNKSKNRMEATINNQQSISTARKELDSAANEYEINKRIEPKQSIINARR